MRTKSDIAADIRSTNDKLGQLIQEARRQGLQVAILPKRWVAGMAVHEPSEVEITITEITRY